MRTKLKGLEWPISKIMKVAIILIVVLCILGLVYKFSPLIVVSAEETKIRGECAKWASEGYNKELFEKNYPTLYKQFGGNYEEAKRFCKQET